MTNKRYGAKNIEWVEQHPNLAIAVANLRGQAGMSEEHIIKAMRREANPASVPSYGDLRAAFDRYQAGHGTIAGQKGKRLAHEKGNLTALTVEEGHSRYRGDRKSQFSDRQRDRQDDKTTMGYLIQAETPAEEFRDPEAYIKWDKDRGYESTPPF